VVTKALPSQRATTDAGFTLIEVMVALVVFTLISTAVLGLMVNSLAVTRSDRARVTAANLAARELEITRTQFQSVAAGPKTIVTGQVVNPNPLPGGTAGAPLVVDGGSYTVTRSAQWQSQGATAGPCDGGASGQLAYLRVTVTVTWPRMNGVAPVTSSTLLTPPLGTYSSGTGHVKVKVTDGNNVPLAGQTVTLSGSSGTSSQQTAADGCAFFAFLSLGDYTATVSKPGHVDPSWNPSPSRQVTVTANTVQPVGFTYAPVATLSLTLAAASGFVPPTNVALTVYNTGLPSNTHTLALPGTGTSRSLSLWPYPDGATVWAGSCLDADPQSHTGGVRANPLITPPGQTTSGLIDLAPVQVTVTSAGGTPLSGATVVAVHAVDEGCPGPVPDPVDVGSAGEVLTLPVPTDALGTTRGALPYGAWLFKVIGKQPQGSWTPATLSPTGLSPAIVAVTTQ
jgi:prepilin-type N-terminal cleavage/methylation domain-containing protein